MYCSYVLHEDKKTKYMIQLSKSKDDKKLVQMN